MNTPKDNTPRIVIMGRPNVGKSTLFNRLISKKKALVHDLPGVTRDRIEETTTWWHQKIEHEYCLIDTGGLGEGGFSRQIAEQVKLAINSASVILFVVDGSQGVTPQDQEVYQMLASLGCLKKCKVVTIVNKVDDHSHEDRVADFYEFGTDWVIGVSAEHARGIDDLKEYLIQEFPNPLPAQAEDSTEEHTQRDRTPKLAIVGKPNVGKSTLTNALLGEQRMITSPIAGTTIDAIDVLTEIDGRPHWIIDTAGIRRKNKTEQGIEVLSVVQAKKALERADVALLVLDGEEGIAEQDEKIGGLIEEVGCSVILVVNKWDTQEENRAFSKEKAAEKIRDKIRFLKYAPIIFTSAIRSEGLVAIADLVEEIMRQKTVKVATHEFTEWVREEVKVNNPNNVRFYLSHQTGRHPPTFVCHVNMPDRIHFSLKRHLMNAIRERWGYMGTPLRLLFIRPREAYKGK